MQTISLPQGRDYFDKKLSKSCICQKFVVPLRQIFDNERMNRLFFIAIVSCIMAMGLHAETIRVLRFVPVAGSESEVALDSLQKVVFTRDSIVLVSAIDGEATPMYKYDYRSILFAESGSQQTVAPATEQQPQAVKFIRDGQLLIRLDEQVYTIFGHKIQ